MTDLSRLVDINRAASVDAEVGAAVDDMFEYHAWDVDQTERGTQVRHLLAQAVKRIIQLVPPCPDRSAAIRKLREARMDCNSAITHKGKY